jgi:hypothetical protein
VLPNLDILTYIYQLKEDMEYRDVLDYYGVLPYDNLQVMKTHYVTYNHMRLTHICMKLVAEPGLLCTFVFNEKDYTSVELEEIDNHNWLSVIPNINFNPPLQDKLAILNSIYGNVYMVSDSLADTLERLHYWFTHTYGAGTNIFRIALDQTHKIYIPYVPHV